MTKQMTLREARCRFTECVAELILEAVAQGFGCALDEVTERLTNKDPTSDHMRGSLHHEGLAVDLILYRDGKYLSKTESYRPLGEWWEKYGEKIGLPLAWGGRFGDGNHFSLAWGGKK